MIRPEDQYHVCMVVDDLDATLELLTAAAGYRWVTKSWSGMPVCFAHGTQRLDIRNAYSVEEPHLEVIQHSPGTIFAPNDAGGLHHIGYWSDDVVADSADLIAAGIPLEASGSSTEGVVQWALHYAGKGPRLELVQRSKPLDIPV